MMYKTKSSKLARELALEKDLECGCCVFDGLCYVGTREELAVIGVVLFRIRD